MKSTRWSARARGGQMKIVSFIERCQGDVIEQILRHCGLWEEHPLSTISTSLRTREHQSFERFECDGRESQKKMVPPTIY